METICFLLVEKQIIGMVCSKCQHGTLEKELGKESQ